MNNRNNSAVETVTNNHRAPVEVAERHQGERTVGFFVGLHRLSCAGKAAAVKVVEQDGASWIQPGIEKFQPGQDRGKEVRVQADQGEALRFKAGGSLRKIPLVDNRPLRKRQAGEHSLRGGVGKFSFLSLGKPLGFFFFHIPGVKALEGVEEIEGPIGKEGVYFPGRIPL